MVKRNYLFWLPVCLLAGLLFFPGRAGAGADPLLRLSVACSEPFAWDYDGDGNFNQVQLWFDVEIQPAVGKKNTPGYRPATGTMRRYLKDQIRGNPVAGYGKQLVADAPRGKPVKVDAVEISGRTVSFAAGGNRYTATDGGPGCKHDALAVNNGFADYPMPLFAGDITVAAGSPQGR